MSTNDINTTARTLLDIKAQIAELEAEAEALTDTLKGAMVEQGTEALTGDGWKASWKNVQSSRFDQKAFKAENPAMAARYMKASVSTRFLIGATEA
ncbi:MAG: hypothetical protein LUF28_08225 [Clostridiales bacterium]|nr:hypothetical protein [Clostridiales bacterium]